MEKNPNLRLLNVARALRESKKPEVFSMLTYVWSSGSTRELIADEPENAIPKPIIENPDGWCGTPACALGHYVVRKDLQNEFRVQNDTRTVFDREKGRDVQVAYKSIKTPYGKLVRYDDGEVQRHFGISSYEAEQLFGPRGCGNAKTPIAAARYIERFVARRLKAERKELAKTESEIIKAEKLLKKLAR